MIDPIVDDGFINLITATPSSGLMASTFICSNLDHLGGTNTYYMKIYKDDKFVINEMVGYMLAKACGLGVSNKAYLLRIGDITKELVNEFHKSNGHVSKVGPINSKFAFIISESPGITINDYPGDIVVKTEYFANKIKKWNCNNKLIAFDEWVANTDRNAGNIIFGQSNNYVIDHGCMPVKIDWGLSDLKYGDCYKNVHMENTVVCLKKAPEDKDIEVEAGYHHQAFDMVESKINSLISNTVMMDNDYSAMIDFIKKRAVNRRTSSYINMHGAR